MTRSKARRMSLVVASCDVLEPRRLFSTVTLDTVSKTLTITLTPEDNFVQVRRDVVREYIGSQNNPPYQSREGIYISLFNSGGSGDIPAPPTGFGLGQVDSIRIIGSDANDAIDVEGDELLATGPLPDDIFIDGRGGSDSLTVTAARGTVLGGDGNDVFFLSDSTGAVFADGGAGNDQFGSAFTQSVTFTETGLGRHTLVGGEGADLFYDTPGDNLIYGGPGPDTVDGTTGNGNDTILGGRGYDLLLGGPGNDSIVGGNGNDTLGGGKGNDALFGLAGDDLLTGGRGQDFLDGGSGNNVLHATDGEVDTLLSGDTSDRDTSLDLIAMD